MQHAARSGAVKLPSFEVSRTWRGRAAVEPSAAKLCSLGGHFCISDGQSVPRVSVPHRLGSPIFTRETSTVANHLDMIAPWRTVSCWGPSKPMRAQVQLRATQAYTIFPTTREQPKWRWSSIRLWSCLFLTFLSKPGKIRMTLAYINNFQVLRAIFSHWTLTCMGWGILSALTGRWLWWTSVWTWPLHSRRARDEETGCSSLYCGWGSAWKDHIPLPIIQ